MKIPNYHPRMSEAIDAAKQYAERQDFEVLDDGLLWEHVPYGETRKRSLELKKDGKASKKMLHVQLYRMESGNYELNCYVN